MALTAMATVTSRKQICHILGMNKPIVVSQSPNKPNIMYAVSVKSETMEETFAPLRLQRTNMDRVIVFCWRYDDVTHIYLFIKSRLGKEIFDPIGAPNLVKYCLPDMFTACTHATVKDAIVAAFTDRSSRHNSVRNGA